MLLQPIRPLSSVKLQHKNAVPLQFVKPAVRLLSGKPQPPPGSKWVPTSPAIPQRGFVPQASSSGNEWNPIEVVKREQGLQSNKLPVELRERVEDAVEELRFRVTVGDVAARAGVKVKDADDALKALAYDAQAALEVSDQGDVVYNFPRDFKSNIQQRSVLLKLVPLWKGAQSVGSYLMRISFGTALFFSVALVWFAIAVLMSSKDRDDRRDRGGYYNGYYGGFNGNGSAARLAFDLTDMFIYLDPNYYRTSEERAAKGAQLTFLEAIFSFVFGDGDPNAKFEDQRWAALGQLIKDRGGVVTAEEMAPFLDPPSIDKSATGAFKDESFVLPALIRLGGEPQVDEASGALLYRFPSLQVSGVNKEWVRKSGWTGSGGAVEVVQEQTWGQTAASSGQVLGVVALGLFNVVGVLVLSGLLADPQARYALMKEGLGWIGNLMPGLQAYALSFFAIPTIRMLMNMNKNNQILERNDARTKAAQVLNSGQNWLRQKLSAARQAGSTRTVQRGDVIFTTDKEAGAQADRQEAQDWERRLKQSESMRGSETRRARRPAQEQGRQAPQPSNQNRAAGRRRDFDGNWM